MNLSPKQQETVNYLKAHGGLIMRFPGGFWTTPDTPTGDAAYGTHNDEGVPRWWVTIQTVRALEKKGVLVRVMRDSKEWVDDRMLIENVGCQQSREPKEGVPAWPDPWPDTCPSCAHVGHRGRSCDSDPHCQCIGGYR